MAQPYGYDESAREAMREHADRWRPYRSYASRYLCRVVD
jgi:DNA-3-methyladenine glycosylase II